MSLTRKDFYAKHISDWCKHCSDRERVATEAERESVKVMQVEYMQQHVGEEFEGIISGVIQYGIFVSLNNLLVEGMLHVRDMKNDYYSYDEKQYALIGERRGHQYRLGDSIKVKVVKVNTERRQIDFVLAEDELERKPKKGVENRKKKKSTKKNRH